MQLNLIEFIDKKLLEVREILRLDDAYYVSDAIIANIEDPDLEALVNDMLKGYGYTEDVIEKIDLIIREIQDFASEPLIEK